MDNTVVKCLTDSQQSENPDGNLDGSVLPGSTKSLR